MQIFSYLPESLQGETYVSLGVGLVALTEGWEGDNVVVGASLTWNTWNSWERTGTHGEEW